MSSNFPLSHERLEDLAQQFPTPFYIYDETAIRENMAQFSEAFKIFPKFTEHFAVKTRPNPYILKILADCGCGALISDSNRTTEALLCKAKIIY